METDNNSVVQRFIATTPGLSATRWLAFVLGSHPQVFVSHGRFPLDSVLCNDFQDERKKGDVESLTIGRAMADFYESASLDQVFAAYRSLKPNARVYGNVHSYTLEGLMRRIKTLHELKGIKVVNILRHPVCYIDSHFHLVRSAERYPGLYRHYAQDVFPDALREFPELFLVACPSYREFVAFTVSCLSVRRMALDFVHTGFQHFRMESLTADLETLKVFCETLTGLVYSHENLDQFIRQGPINRHRKDQASTDPRAIYSGWPDWKQDIASMVMPDTLLAKFEEQGYEIGMLRDKAPVRHATPKPLISCLGDRLRMMDDRHPLLALMSPTGEAEPRLRDSNYEGYNLVEFLGRIYALACELGPLDLRTMSDEALQEYQHSGDCFIGESVEELRHRIIRARGLSPILVEPEFHGFNLVKFAGQVYALACSLGPVDLTQLPKEILGQYVALGECFTGSSIAEVKAKVLLSLEVQPVLLEADCYGFNIVGYHGRIYALACSLGPVDLAEIASEILQQYQDRQECFVGQTLEEVKRGIHRAAGRGVVSTSGSDS